MIRLPEFLRARDLFVNLTLRELRGKYKRSLLGWTWSLLNPLATMGIFYVVFRVFLKVPVPKGDPSGLEVFAFFLLCGLLPWNLLANGLASGMGSLLANGGLIKKVYFPREVLVGSTVAAWVVSSLIELGVLAVVFLVAGNFVIPYLPVVLVLVALQALMIFGISMLLSVVNVYFRDVQHFFGIAMQLWFYATPIVYPPDLVPVRASLLGVDLPIREILRFNPMVQFVEAYRNCLYDLRLPSAATFAYLALVTAATLVIGRIVFLRLEPRLAEEL